MNKQLSTNDEIVPETVSRDDIETKIDDTGRRSKLYIKLNKKFSKAFAAFCDAAKPENMSDTEFASMIFMVGMDAIQQQIQGMETAVEEQDNEKPEPKVV